MVVELTDFPPSLLFEVCQRFEAPDLLKLACTCKAFNQIATYIGERYWRNLYSLHYSYEAQGGKPDRGWESLYKDCFVKTKRIRQRALQRKAIVIENDIQDVNREIRTLKEEANDLINQERAESMLYLEIDRGRSAKVALETWSPVSVSVWHQQVVEQTPLDKETRMGDLVAKLKVTKLLLKNVLQRLETKKRKLSDLKDSLQNVNVTSTT
jgi:hypothetical protein